jgi:hypothetical protein
MKLPYEESDLAGIKTYPLRSRQSKVSLAQFATPHTAGSGIGGLMKSLPNLLAAKDFKDVVAAIVAAKRADRAIIWGLGAHVLKTGLSPVLVDLMQRGFISAIATNGAGIIPRFRDRAVGRHIGRRRRDAWPGHVRHGRGDRHAAESRDQRRRGRGTRTRSVGGEVS